VFWTKEDINLVKQKSFFKVSELAKIETARENFLGTLAPSIQNVVRGFLGRKTYHHKREMVAACLVLQRTVRNYVQLKKWPWFRLYLKSKPHFKRMNIKKILDAIESKIQLIQEQTQEAKELQSSLKAQSAGLNTDIEKMKKELDSDKGKNNKSSSELDNLKNLESKANNQIQDLEKKILKIIKKNGTKLKK